MKSQFTTKDIYLAAFLLAATSDLLSSSRTNGITTFVFVRSSKTDQLVTDYYAQRALVNPVTYGNALRNLKSIIHADADSKENSNYVEQYRTEQ